MKSARVLGNVSLLVAAGGLALIETALTLQWVHGPAWQVLVQAFEAATVGGVADWFAVTALLHEVPLPFLRRHTNIVVKNRVRIVSGIAGMVQNRWLSPDVIRQHLDRFSASQQLIGILSDKPRVAGLVSFLRDLLRRVAQGIEAPEVAAFLDSALKKQLADFDLAEPLGRWLALAIRQGNHQAIWETVLLALEESTHAAEFREAVQGILAGAIQEYRKASFLQGVTVQVAEVLRLIPKDDQLVDFLLRNIEQGARDARGSPGHPLRERLDGVLLEFADGLAAGKPEVRVGLEKLQRAFADSADTREYIAKALVRIRETVDSELSKPGSDLDRLISNIIRIQLERFREDAGIQAKFDAWVRGIAIELVEERHAEIGVMVRGSLEKLSDQDLVAQIEGQVGNDLQYIRLNGAIVGGLAGTVLALVKLLL